MPLPTKMAYEFRAADLTDIQEALDKLLTVINSKGAINLTKEERKAANSVADGRFSYVEKTFTNLAINFPNIRPSFGTFDDSLKDYQYMLALRSMVVQLTRLVEIYTDHAMSAENLAYRYMGHFYSNAKRAAADNVPGADTCVDELAPLFERSNSEPAPDAPPA